MINFVLPHLASGLLLWAAISQFLSAKRRGVLAPLEYWQLGMCVEALWLVCVAGFIASIVLYVTKMLKTDKALKKIESEMEAQLNEIIKNIEEAQETIYSRELPHMMEAPYDQR